MADIALCVDDVGSGAEFTEADMPPLAVFCYISRWNGPSRAMFGKLGFRPLPGGTNWIVRPPLNSFSQTQLSLSCRRTCVCDSGVSLLVALWCRF